MGLRRAAAYLVARRQRLNSGHNLYSSILKLRLTNILGLYVSMADVADHLLHQIGF